MFSAVRAGTNLVPQLASGLRLFSKSVTMKSIFDTLNSNHIYPVIPAIRRDRDGTNYSRFLRKNGAIPGVLYGSDGNGNDERILIAVPTNEVDRFIKRLNLSLECTLFHLDLEGERILCFPRQLSWHPGSVLLVQLCVVTDRPENLNFIRLNQKTGTYVKIPIRYYNHQKNKEIKMGGFLSTATRFLDVRVKGNVTYVPPYINCNLENLTHKRAFGVDDLDFDRTKFSPHPKMFKRVFASISGKVKGDDASTSETTE